MQVAANLTIPELLAPAGDWDALRAAVANGADAVYFGLDRFNARFRAANFSIDELGEVMAYLHGHNARGYVAFNILIFSDELPDALDFIRAIAAAGVDAVIVQDLGLARLIGKMCPGLAVHGSTQMTLTEPLGVEFVRRLGVERVILARELSANDIRKIHAATDLPIEVFIHGALCVSYSGQCLTSESLGGRSANRGQCAQACRLPYDLIVDGQRKDLGEKSYLLSPQDLAAYDIVEELANAGVCSLKIEGRLKSAQYVAATTSAYRSAIDALRRGEPFVLPREKELAMAQSFSRGFTHGFLDGVNHQSLVHARFPKSRGVRVGRVTAVTPRGAVIQLESASAATTPRGFSVDSAIKIGDGLVFDEGHPEQDEQGGRVASVTLMKSSPSAPSRGGGHTAPRSGTPQLVEIAFERGGVNLGAISVGATVWKTDDPAIRRRLESSYARDLVIRRVPLSATVSAAVGQPLVVTLRDNEERAVTVQSDEPLQEAVKFPLTEASFREQFGRLGDTPFELGQVSGLETPAPTMAPKSVLNELRRRATAKLVEMRSNARIAAIEHPNVLQSLRDEIATKFSDEQTSHSPGSTELHVLVRTMDQLSHVLAWRDPAGLPAATVYCDFEDVRKYRQAVPLARVAGVPIGLATVRVVKPGEEGLLRLVADCEPDFVLIRNLAGLVFFPREAPRIQLIGDYALNVSNEATAALMTEQGLKRLTPSYDLSWRQLSELLTRFPARLFEQVIHQHMPMFHMEHCVFAHTLSNGTDYRTCGRPCESHKVDLRDRTGAAHPLIPDVGCRNTVFNAAAQTAAEFIPRMKELGLRHFRVELLREEPTEAVEILTRYARIISGAEDGRQIWRQLKVLNQLGVTRGTLDNERPSKSF